jgi:hypothetical protein
MRIDTRRKNKMEAIMPIVDSDAHVIETPETWSYLSRAERKFEPMIVTRKSGPEENAYTGKAIGEYWVIDGLLLPKDQNIGQEATPEAREAAGTLSIVSMREAAVTKRRRLS